MSLVLLCVFALGFGTPPGDAVKLRQFAEAVEGWQHNPDFRHVQVEYVELGSAAMQTKTAWVDTTKGILWLRSIPGLPEHLRVNPTSRAHYVDFAKGPLSAYLHLCDEQGLGETLGMLSELGRRAELTDQDVVEFLRHYKLHNPVVSDAGAVQSVRALVRDVQPGRGFVVQHDVSAKLRGEIAKVATALGYPADPGRMNAAQQMDVWRRLDDAVRLDDYELWRSKQVNDWLNGVWGQVYGTMYSGLIRPVLVVERGCRIVGPMLLVGWVGVVVWKRRRTTLKRVLSE